MEVKSVIAMVVEVALVVIIGFLVIGMIQLFLQQDGVIWTFFEETLGAICTKAQELIDGYTSNNGTLVTPSVTP